MTKLGQFLLCRTDSSNWWAGTNWYLVSAGDTRQVDLVNFCVDTWLQTTNLRTESPRTGNQTHCESSQSTAESQLAPGQDTPPGESPPDTNM